jgi:hypothetical protein
MPTARNQCQQAVTADLHLLCRETANNCPLYLFQDHRFVFKRVQGNQDGLKFNDTHQLLVNADDINISAEEYIL